MVTFFFYVVFDVLRAPPTQERFTAVLGRQPGEYIILYLLNRMGHAWPIYRCASDNLFERGESASNDAYSLPSQRFSLALSFPQLSPLLWRTSQLYISHDFMK